MHVYEIKPNLYPPNVVLPLLFFPSLRHFRRGGVAANLRWIEPSPCTIPTELSPVLKSTPALSTPPDYPNYSVQHLSLPTRVTFSTPRFFRYHATSIPAQGRMSSTPRVQLQSAPLPCHTSFRSRPNVLHDTGLLRYVSTPHATGLLHYVTTLHATVKTSKSSWTTVGWGGLWKRQSMARSTCLYIEYSRCRLYLEIRGPHISWLSFVQIKWSCVYNAYVL